MTEGVACLVLRNNYLQTQAISIAESNAAERLREHAHLIRLLNATARLRRAIEFLPTDDTSRRAKMGRGLSAAGLLAALLQQISLYSALVARTCPGSYRERARAFPEPLQKRYRELMRSTRSPARSSPRRSPTTS
jgi:glutamate dehydrogenase